MSRLARRGRRGTAPRLVKVTAPTDEMIHELEESYDVGYMADHTRPRSM